MAKATLSLAKVTLQDNEEIGRAFANLGNFISIGENLPKGFLITFSTFEDIFNERWEQIKYLLHGTKLSDVSPEFSTGLKNLLVNNIYLPPSLGSELKNELSSIKFPVQVQCLIRAPKGHELIKNLGVIENRRNIEEHVKNALLSFLDPDVLKNNTDVQELPKTLVSVLFTQKNHPDVSGSASILPPKKGLIEISAGWGEHFPSRKEDNITVNAQDLSISKYEVADQETQFVWNNGKPEALTVSKRYRMEKKLSDETLVQICKTLKKLQSLLLRNVKVDFEVSGRKLYFTALTYSEEPLSLLDKRLQINLPLIQTLKPLFPGLTSGLIKYVDKVSDLPKIRRGEIAVINSIKKGHLRFLRKASGIIIRKTANFQKSHSHLINQLGVGMAIGDLKTYLEGIVTLDGKTGKIYRGSFFPLMGKILEPAIPKPTPVQPTVTATKVFAYSSDTTHLLKTDFEEVDGIGPVRLELLFTRSGFHPRKLLEKGKRNKLIQQAEEQLSEICTRASGKTVIYQLTDFKSHDLLHLSAGAEFENKDQNPFLGLRGTERLLANRQLLEFELHLVKNLRNRDGFKNLWLSLPFVRNREELVEIKKLLSANTFHRSSSQKLLISIAVPANVFSLEELHEIGVDGFLINYWELTNLIYGKDLTYTALQKINDPSVEKAIRTVVTYSNRNGLFSGIYNLPLETENNLLTKLVSWGIRVVCIGPDLTKDLRKQLAVAEKDLITHKYG